MSQLLMPQSGYGRGGGGSGLFGTMSLNLVLQSQNFSESNFLIPCTMYILYPPKQSPRKKPCVIETLTLVVIRRIKYFLLTTPFTYLHQKIRRLYSNLIYYTICVFFIEEIEEDNVLGKNIHIST